MRLLTILLAAVLLFNLCGCTKCDLNKQSLQHTANIAETTDPAKEVAVKQGVVVEQTPTVTNNVSEFSGVAVEIFYASSKQDPDVMEPDKTYPVKIALQAANDKELLIKAIELMIAGPSKDDKKDGFYTTIPEGTKINSVSIDKDIISIDFNSKLNEGGGSCDMSQRRSQIENTIRHLPFAKDKKINITVEGDNAQVLQP